MKKKKTGVVLCLLSSFWLLFGWLVIFRYGGILQQAAYAGLYAVNGIVSNIPRYAFTQDSIVLLAVTIGTDLFAVLLAIHGLFLIHKDGA